MVGLIDRLILCLALGLAVEPAQPDVAGFVGLAAEAAADHHALGDLEGDDLLLHHLDPGGLLAGQDLVLAKLVERGHAGVSPLESRSRARRLSDRRRAGEMRLATDPTRASWRPAARDPASGRRRARR